jgi:hypothetical protein
MDFRRGSKIFDDKLPQNTLHKRFVSIGCAPIIPEQLQPGRRYQTGKMVLGISHKKEVWLTKSNFLNYKL